LTLAANHNPWHDNKLIIPCVMWSPFCTHHFISIQFNQ